MKTFLFFLIAVPATCIANAQNAPIQPKFEVASVKRTDRCFAGNPTIDPESVILKGVPLKSVLTEAFKVRFNQVEGPSWLETDCFEISAKIPEGATRDQLPAMLQTLLIERFKLAAHKEVRSRSGYALVVDKGGPKFKEDDPNTNFMGAGRSGTMLFGASGHGRLKGVMTMKTLAAHLSTDGGYGPVQDLTGLTGKYDIDLTWTPDQTFEPSAGAADIPAPEANLFTAVRESLGLKLERRNVEVQFVVVDHIERIPTENSFMQEPIATVGLQNLQQKFKYSPRNDGVAAAEIGVRLMRPGRYQELGLTLDQARALGREYVQALKEAHGDAAAREIGKRISEALR